MVKEKAKEKEGKMDNSTNDYEHAESVIKADSDPGKMMNDASPAKACKADSAAIEKKMNDSSTVSNDNKDVSTSGGVRVDYIPEKMRKDTTTPNTVTSSVLRYKGYLDNNPDHTNDPYGSGANNGAGSVPTRQVRRQTSAEPGAYALPGANGRSTTGLRQVGSNDGTTEPLSSAALPSSVGGGEGAATTSPPDTDHSNQGEEGLAVAQPISAHSHQEFQQAEQVLDPQDRRRRRRGNGVQTGGSLVGKSHMSQEDTKRLEHTLAIMACVVILVAVTLTVVFVSQGKSSKNVDQQTTSAVPDDSNNLTNSTPQTPTNPSIEQQKELFVKSLLPDYTVASLQEDQSSPQYLAYQWTLKDPRLLEYPDWRVLQRFSLATIFHSTDGFHSWRNSSGWLDYNIHECLWWGRNFHTPPGMTIVDLETGDYLPPDFAFPKHPNACGLPEDDLLSNNITMNTTGIYQHLRLWGGGLKGSLPPETFLLTNLRAIAMMANPGLTGTLPSQIGHLTKLRGISFAKTSVGGSLPTEIGLLTNILLFHFPLSRFTGTIPTEIGLNSLSAKWFRMDYTKISGPIPSQVGLLTCLDRLLLSQTGLTGTIPTELGQLASSLKWMEVRQTKVNGRIPSELGLLSKLGTLHLQGNSLSGLVPWTELSNLAAKGNNASNHHSIGSLATLNLTGNELLSGTIPMEVCSGVEALSFDCTSQLCGCSCECSNEMATAKNETGEGLLLRRRRL